MLKISDKNPFSAFLLSLLLQRLVLLVQLVEALTARRHLRPKLATAGEQTVQLLGTVLRIVVVLSGAALQQTAELDAGVFAFARHLERRRRSIRGGGLKRHRGDH